MKTTTRILCSSIFAAVVLIGAPSRPAHAAGNPAAGGDVYDSECSDCHSLRQGKNKKGPSLYGVVGRHAGSVAGFKYSDPMLKSGIVWTPEKIQSYIAAPKKVVPGGKMKYDGGGLKAQDIADLLAFLSAKH